MPAANHTSFPAPNNAQMPLSREHVRSIDRIAIDEFAMSGLVLMENAGRGAALGIDAFIDSTPGKISILCGPGNNGGDGYVIARHLNRIGYQINIYSLVPLKRLTGDALANANIAIQSELPITFVPETEELSRALSDNQAIIDCMLGTGAHGAPRGIYRECVDLANRFSRTSNTTLVAIDIPTGLDCDSGIPADPTFQADLTMTFVDHKIGFEKSTAKPFLGQIETVDIGVPNKLLKRFGVF